jgi:TRAP transporter TAXI family solute receptor
MPRKTAVAVALAALATLSTLTSAFAQTGPLDRFPADDAAFGDPNDQPPVQIAQDVAQRTAQRPTTAAALGESQIIERTNAWTIGLAAGLPQGTFLPMADEIARNVNDGQNLRVLPIVTPGGTENIKDLLYLRGVDAAIVNTDVLEHYKTVEKIANIERRITYITGLYVSEIHLVVRADIQSLKDLEGKKVSFGQPGFGANITGQIVFQRLGIKVEPVLVNNAAALDRMKTGEIAGFVHNGGKPNALIARFKNDPRYRILDIPFEKFDEYYVPATLTSQDYPNFIKPGEKVETIAVPAVLAVYNWPRTSDRFRRVSRFVDYLFDRFDRFKGPGYSPLWKDINLAAQVPGWNRYWVAEEKLKQLKAQTAAPAPSSVDVQLARQQAARAAPGDAAAQERLFQQFLEWSKQQNRR